MHFLKGINERLKNDLYWTLNFFLSNMVKYLYYIEIYRQLRKYRFTIHMRPILMPTHFILTDAK